MSKFLYAFFQDEDGNDLVAVEPRDHWEQERCLKDHYSDEEWSALESTIDEADLGEYTEGVFEWPPNKTMADVKAAFDRRPDMFQGSEEFMKFVTAHMGAPEPVTPQTEAEVSPSRPAPKPVQPAAPPLPLIQRTDVMRIQIGNHEIKIPLDVNTAMMFAQTFQAYAQYQIVTGGVQPVTQQLAAQAPIQSQVAQPILEKPKSVPKTPDTDLFQLSNSMRGEFLDVHGQTVVKIEQGGKLIAETKPCDTRDEAYDIANRFARMIPGMTKPGEIIRK